MYDTLIIDWRQTSNLPSQSVSATIIKIQFYLGEGVFISQVTPHNLFNLVSLYNCLILFRLLHSVYVYIYIFSL